MTPHRIDSLKEHVVHLQDLTKSLPKGSPAHTFAESQLEAATRELDAALNLPRQKATEGPKEARREQNNPCETLAMHLSQAGLPPPEREVRFLPARRWRFDLAWPDRKLAVEVHGGVYTNGRHTRGKGFTRDREKMNEALLLGWRVLEVTSEQVQSGQALTWIEKALEVASQVIDMEKKIREQGSVIECMKAVIEGTIGPTRKEQPDG